MAGNKDLSDEYVAGVLERDAHDSSIKYSAIGLQASMPKRTNPAVRKPNTRFLSHLLRDTDAHNAALLAKEQREARQRQMLLKERGEHIRSSREDKFGTRHDSPDRPHKRRRVDSDRPSREGNHKKRRSRSPERSSHRDHRHRSRSRRATSPEDDDKRGSRHRSSRHDRHGDDSTESHRRHHRHSHSHRDTSPAVGHRRDQKRKDRPTPSPAASDSDPLEAIVGPLPAPQVKVRGRGAVAATSSSAIDTHFSSKYDPSADVAVPEPSHNDDWDMALEALRDRQRWVQAGAERLRAAGFTDSQVDKWAKGGSRGEKDESYVRWAKEGEGREWDRGKVVGSDDEIELRPEWGRLKGT